MIKYAKKEFGALLFLSESHDVLVFFKVGAVTRFCGSIEKFQITKLRDTQVLLKWAKKYFGTPPYFRENQASSFSARVATKNFSLYWNFPDARTKSPPSGAKVHKKRF